MGDRNVIGQRRHWIYAAVLAFAATASHAGLVEVDGHRAGTIVAYSAARGDIALDSRTGSDNSPYAEALLRFLEVPVDVGLMLRWVRDAVLESTSGNQEPTIVHSSISGRSIYLDGRSLLRSSGLRRGAETGTERNSSARVALTIGNAAYARFPQKNPLNDASAIAAALERLGFTVVRLADVSRLALESALDEFSMLVSEAEIAVVYYAGFMVSAQNQDYLVPVDAELESAQALETEFVPMSRIMAAVERASVLRLVLIDGPTGSWPPSSATR